MTMIPTRDQSPHLAGPSKRPLRPSRPGGVGTGLTPRDIWRIIRKRKWLIILPFVICLSLTTAATFLWWKFAPGYTARAFLAISPPPATLMRAGATPIYGKDIIERYKRTKAALVKHLEVLRGAADDSRIMGDEKDPPKKWYLKYKNKILQQLDEDIKVSLMPDTNTIQLSMTGRNRPELADIVNSVADSLVRFTMRGPRKARKEKINKLTSEKNRIMVKLNGLRQEMSSLKQRSIPAMRETQNVITLKLNMLTKDIQEAQMEKKEAEEALVSYQKQVEELKKQIESGKQPQITDPNVLQAVEFDGTLRGLKAQLANLETSLFNASEKYQPKHREIQNIERLIEATKIQIGKRENHIINSQFAMLGQGRHMMAAMANGKLDDLTVRLERVQSDAKDLEAALGRITTIRFEIDDYQREVSQISIAVRDQRLLGSRPGKEGEETGPVTVEAYATPPRPDQWSQPKWSLMIPLGAFVGLAIGFGLTFLLELTDTSVKGPSDLARRIDLPLLGMVPHRDDMDEEIDDFSRVTLLAPHSPAAEAFRQIRTNLLFSGPAQQRKSLLVISPSPQDGRTTVVMNLAVSMAQSGRRVLVVDANFYKPAIAQMFPQASGEGLSSALVGQAKWQDVVSTTDVDKLSVITAGPLPPNPAELLGSDAMSRLVSEMTAEYDQVIFDGPPAMVVSDTCVFSTKVDGVIMVVRAGSNSVGIVQRTADRVSQVGGRILGLVLQGVRVTAGGYLRKNYETFYEYHQKSLP